MTQPRQQEASAPSLQEEVAWFVGGILLGTITVPNPTLTIAEALVNLVPAFLPAELRENISDRVAQLVLVVPVDQPKLQNGSGVLSVASTEELKYRVAYGFEAIKRLAKAVAERSSEVSMEESLDKALQAERNYLIGHLNASKKRTEIAQLLGRATTVYGPVLSWHAVERPTSRPHHLAADKHNWNVANGAPRATGALPGTQPHCLCTFGPPIPGAGMLR